MEASSSSKPLQTTQPIRMQGQQKILPPAAEEVICTDKQIWARPRHLNYLISNIDENNMGNKNPFQ